MITNKATIKAMEEPVTFVMFKAILSNHNLKPCLRPFCLMPKALSIEDKDGGLLLLTVLMNVDLSSKKARPNLPGSVWSSSGTGL